jgi:hypothetical protein
MNNIEFHNFREEGRESREQSASGKKEEMRNAKLWKRYNFFVVIYLSH